MMSSDMGEGLAFPSGFRGRSSDAVFPCLASEDDAECGAPVVRLLVPVDCAVNDPPFRLPGRARWEICRQGQRARCASARDFERYTFVVWEGSDCYQFWLQRLIEGEDGRADIMVVLHESDAHVPRTLGGRSVLRLDCKGDLYGRLFALVGVLVAPAVFQSIAGADPVDFRHLSRFGGELRLFHAHADEVETIAERIADFVSDADCLSPDVTGLCLTAMVPLALPIIESIDALSRASRYQDTIADGVDVVLTAFAHRESGFSLTMLWISGDDHSLEDA
jgi:hypothetical protein